MSPPLGRVLVYRVVVGCNTCSMLLFLLQVSHSLTAGMEPVQHLPLHGAQLLTLPINRSINQLINQLINSICTLSMMQFMLELQTGSGNFPTKKLPSLKCIPCTVCSSCAVRVSPRYAV